MNDQRHGPAVNRSDATVLIVEDDAAMRDLVVEELSDLGFHVLAADGGKAASRW